MTNSIGCEEQAWKKLIANAVDKELENPRQSTTELYLEMAAASPAISYLGQSKNCGLPMLVEKLLAEAKNNVYTKHLISTLINRLHHNSITIHASTTDDAETFILKMITMAMHFSKENEPEGHVRLKSANLFTSAIQKFDMQQIDAEVLEYEWKEFLFHFYRSRLKEWA